VRSSKLINPELSSRDEPKISEQLDNFMLGHSAVLFCDEPWQKRPETPDFAVK
jgi:hypothetical protein